VNIIGLRLHWALTTFQVNWHNSDRKNELEAAYKQLYLDIAFLQSLYMIQNSQFDLGKLYAAFFYEITWGHFPLTLCGMLNILIYAHIFD